jgi:2-amino-4-hydroxy-6-hydroxymethyldihydropteridine diphosphokinase
MHIAYLLTGTNLGDRKAHLERAIKEIGMRCGTVRETSAVFETAAWGKEDQPSFLNQAISLETSLSPRALLQEILEIERSMGRVREEKYGARVIDIDILFFDDIVIHEEGLTIPHPHLHKRRFALECMNDIQPRFVHPVFEKSISELLLQCEDKLDVVRLE